MGADGPVAERMLEMVLEMVLEHAADEADWRSVTSTTQNLLEAQAELFLARLRCFSPLPPPPSTFFHSLPFFSLCLLCRASDSTRLLCACVPEFGAEPVLQCGRVITYLSPV